jgi:hypothetical protein
VHLSGLVEIERLRSKIDAIREHLAAMITVMPAAALAGAVEPEYTSDEIQSLALRAVVNTSRLDSAEAERQWTAWRRGLQQYLPPLVAEEVARKAAELRQRAGR